MSVFHVQASIVAIRNAECEGRRKNIHIKKGNVVVIFPNTVHEYIECDSLCNEPTETVALISNTKLLAESMSDIVTKHSKNPYIDSSLLSENAYLAFKNILSASNTIEHLGWACIALSELFSILELAPAEGDLDLASKVLAYVDANFKENLTINHIAKVLGYHPSYIAHLFCDRLKIPFRTYLGAVRSEYATSQIRTTKKNLTEIAYESGYCSLNTFCRCFKKHFSQTPSQYKNFYRK